jgi:hypothetical protein
MDQTPTFVIGVGEIGVEAVAGLQSRYSESDALGLMAIDTKEARLDRISGMPTLYLRSESGLLGARADGYPFLQSDVHVPKDGANQRRHIGRHKLDNSVSPSFSSHRQSISTHLEGFMYNIENSLDQIPGTYNIVLVSSMADGTGSGTFPLLAALLQDIEGKLSSESRRIHLCYLGVVPSLDDRDTSTEPWAYVNTLAALKNLDTLLDTGSESSLTLPVYSRQHTDSIDERREVGRYHISIETSPFDACWLVENEHDETSRGNSQRDCDRLATVCDGLYSLTTNTPTEYELLDPGSSISALGTFGYGYVAVPHERVGQFCELKADRDEVEQQLEEYVHPKLNSLRTRKEELESTLDTEPEEPPLLDHWVGWVSSWLDPGPETREDLVYETEPDQLKAILNRFSETDIHIYLLAAKALRCELSERGEAGALVLTEVRQTLATLYRTHYDEPFQNSEMDISTVGNEPHDREDLERVVTEFERELEQAQTDYRERLSGAEPELRDYLPPVCEAFMSTRDRLARDIDQVTESLQLLEAAKQKLQALHDLHTIARRHENEAREILRQELEGVEADIDHFRTELQRLRERRQSLTDRINTERQLLIRPRNAGAVRYLPLRYDELQTVTREEHSEELTSLKAYNERGLIDGDEDEVRELIRECYRESRNWSPSISRHDLSVAIDSVHESTFVLYQEENHQFIEGLASSFTEPDTIRSSTENATCFLDDPFRIEIISLSHGGKPHSLEGFCRLTDWEQSGKLQALATTKYDDYRRAIAYPEWYDHSKSEFE